MAAITAFRRGLLRIGINQAQAVLFAGQGISIIGDLALLTVKDVGTVCDIIRENEPTDIPFMTQKKMQVLCFWSRSMRKRNLVPTCAMITPELIEQQ